MEENELAQLYSLMRPRKICLCKAVSETDLVDCIINGANSLEELIFRTGASTKCGSCRSMVIAIFEREIKKIDKNTNL
ncbi:MAG: (2Fe-2S)-binding protein [Leptospiraceae bacterium]|nr:(2Fe-2S)-binding protein [Leptospiraceae bacterium]